MYNVTTLAEEAELIKKTPFNIILIIVLATCQLGGGGTNTEAAIPPPVQEGQGGGQGIKRGSIPGGTQVGGGPTLTAGSNTLPPATAVTPTATVMPVSSPTPSPSPTPGCTETKGKVISDEYQGINVKFNIPILVYLPPCYDSGKITYPVLYLLHGKPFNRNHWVSLGVDAAADNEIQRDGSAGFIMVMPDIPEPLFSSTDGGPWSYEAEFTEGLMPHIETTYRVIRSPEAMAIAGISRGGIWALEIGLSRPDLFGTVIALSPALSANYPRPEYDPFSLAGNAKEYQRFLLVAGDTDWALTDTVRLSKVLAKQGTFYDLEIVSGDHEAKTWTLAIPKMLQFVTEGWQVQR